MAKFEQSSTGSAAPWPNALVTFLSRWARKESKAISFALFCDLVGLTAALAAIYFLGQVVYAVQSNTTGTVYGFGTEAILCLGIYRAARLAAKYLFNSAGLSAQQRLQQSSFQHALTLGLKATQECSPARLKDLLNDPPRRLALLIGGPLHHTLYLSILVTTCSAAIWVMYWPIGLLVTAVTAMILINRWRHHWAPQRYHDEEADKHNDILEFEHNVLQSMAAAQHLDTQRKLGTLHSSLLGEARQLGRTTAWRSLLSREISWLALAAGLALAFRIGVGAADNDELSAQAFYTLLAYAFLVLWSTRSLVDTAARLSEPLEHFGRAMAFLDQAPAVTENPQSRKLQARRGQLAFHDVSFQYQDGPQILRKATFEIPAGQRVALIGGSGTGKITLVKLLLRLWDPQAGYITIDSIDTREVTLGSLREHIGVIWKEPFYIEDSIRANMLLADPEAQDSDIVTACQAANIWDIVQQSTQGLDTILGPKGLVLNSSERQRFAIAQMFLRDPIILVVEELTGTPDANDDALLAEAVRNLTIGRTSLIIAHRINSIKDAQKVLYFNGNGTITAGQHQELMEAHAAYRSAVQWQTRRAS